MTHKIEDPSTKTNCEVVIGFCVGKQGDQTKQGLLAVVKAHAEAIRHFGRRAIERGLAADECLIVVLNVDDPHGGSLADVLMPDTDWQPHRDRGYVPYARGLTEREGIQDAVEYLNPKVGAELRLIEGIPVVVIDSGLVAVFDVDYLKDEVGFEVDYLKDGVGS